MLLLFRRHPGRCPLPGQLEGQGVVKRRGGGNRGKDGDVGCGGWCGEGGGGGQRAPLCVLIPFIVGALVSEDLISRQICQ